MECESPASVVSHASTESSAGSSADGDDDALDGRVDGPPEEAAAAAAAAAAIDDAGEDAGEDADEDEPGEPEAGAGDEPTKPKKLAISKLTTATGDGSAPCVALDLVTSGNSKSLRIIAALPQVHLPRLLRRRRAPGGAAHRQEGTDSLKTASKSLALASRMPFARRGAFRETRDNPNNTEIASILLVSSRFQCYQHAQIRLDTASEPQTALSVSHTRHGVTLSRNSRSEREMASTSSAGVTLGCRITTLVPERRSP